MYLFSVVADLDLHTDVSEIYDPFWTTHYIQSFKENYDKLNYL
jgi:hypothetical protein